MFLFEKYIIILERNWRSCNGKNLSIYVFPKKKLHPFINFNGGKKKNLNWLAQNVLFITTSTPITWISFFMFLSYNFRFSFLRFCFVYLILFFFKKNRGKLHIKIPFHLFTSFLLFFSFSLLLLIFIFFLISVQLLFKNIVS